MLWKNDKFYDNLLLHSAGLTHQKGFAEVATRLLTDLFGQLRWEEQTLLFTDRCQNITDLENRKNTETRKKKVTISTNHDLTYALNFRHSIMLNSDDF